MLKHKNQLHEGANLLAFSFFRMRIKSHDRYKTRGEKEIYFSKKKKKMKLSFLKSHHGSNIFGLSRKKNQRENPGLL